MRYWTHRTVFSVFTLAVVPGLIMLPSMSNATERFF